jgi:hypothetical protein
LRWRFPVLMITVHTASYAKLHFGLCKLTPLPNACKHICYVIQRYVGICVVHYKPFSFSPYATFFLFPSLLSFSFFFLYFFCSPQIGTNAFRLNSIILNGPVMSPSPFLCIYRVFAKRQYRLTLPSVWEPETLPSSTAKQHSRVSVIAPRGINTHVLSVGRWWKRFERTSRW